MARPDPLVRQDSPVFVDTSGLFAILSTQDKAHKAVQKLLSVFSRTRRRALTTDYVLDETFSLLKARGLRHLTPLLRNLILTSKSLHIEWTQPAQFMATADFYLKRLDQEFSFTDCRSFLLMQEHGLRDAVTTDHHFAIAGFRVLLAP